MGSVIVVVVLLIWLATSIRRAMRFNAIEEELLALSARLKRLEALERRVAEVQPARPYSAPQPAEQPKPEAEPAATEPEPAVAPEQSDPTEAPPPIAKAPEPVAAMFTPAPPRDLESTLGSRWAVWVGGIALTLGGIFLVRYTIDEGLLTPALRIILALLLGLTAVAAGEYLRRSERRIAFAVIPAAHIPSILTAAGICVTFGTVYAAQVLYGLIGPDFAFVAMAAVGVLALVAALAHGPALAALGLVGVYTTPILIGGKPDFAALAAYLATVTAIVLVLNRFRPSDWIVRAALVLNGLWALPFITVGKSGDSIASVIQIVAAPLLAFGLAAPALLRKAEHRRPAGVSGLFALAIAFAAAVLWISVCRESLILPATLSLTTLVVAGALAAWSSAAFRRAAPIVAIAVQIAGLVWPAGGGTHLASVFLGRHLEPSGGDLLYLILTASAAAIALPALHVLARPGGAERGTTYVFVAAMLPVGSFALGALHATGFSSDIALGVLALVLAAALYGAGEYLHRHSVSPQAGPLFAAAAAIALGLACGLGVPGVWMHTALAVAAAGAALVAAVRPFPILAPMSAALAAAAALRLASAPVLSEVGETPILNLLIAAYAVPAAALALAAWLLRGRDGTARTVHAALAMLFGALFVLLEIRHFFHGPLGMVGGAPRYDEIVVIVLALLALTSFAARLHTVWPGAIARFAAAGGLAAAALVTAIWLFAALNPLFDGSRIDGPVFFNRLTFGYGFVAAAFAGTAWILRRASAPAALRRSARIAAWTVGTATGLLVLRHIFHGADIGISRSILLAEGGVYAAFAFAVAAALTGLQRNTSLHIAAFTGAAGLSMTMQGLVTNPLRTREIIGGLPLLDTAALGYLAPALAAGAAAATARDRSLRAIAGMTALMFGFTFLVAEIRRAFVGPDIAVTGVSDAESYTYSAAILLYGLAILAAGFRIGSRDIRLASAVAIVAAVLKAFLIDMSVLEGIWRALSFIGLGLVMLGIGLLYQRLLARPDAANGTLRST